MDASQKVKTLPGEVWQKVDFGTPTLHFDYFISNMGRIKSYHKRTTGERMLKGSIDHRGFHRLHIRLADKTYGELALHIFIGNNFCEKPSDDYNHAIHLDYDRSNNKWTNIKWLKHAEWKEYMQNSPTYKETRKKKEKHYRMSPDRVHFLKVLLQLDKISKKELAELFEITPMQIYRIEKDLNWSHITVGEKDLEETGKLDLAGIKKKIKAMKKKAEK